MRFACLGSGSRGNAWLVSHGDTHVLVDCGFSLRQLEQRLHRLGLAREDLTAILVTHEHSDHATGVRRLVERQNLALGASVGTLMSAALDDLPHETLRADEPFVIGELQVHPYTVPHDAREPLQFVFDDGRHRLGLLTDCGHITPHVCEALNGCDALVVECNHDPERLAQGDYPPRVKARVGGEWGHLSNPQAQGLMAEVDSSRLRWVVAAHLSERHNTPALARTALAAGLGAAEEDIQVAHQDEGLPWLIL